MMKYFIALLILLFTSLTWAGSVTLEWDANTESDLDGYKIHYKIGSSGEPYNGTRATEGISPVDVGNVTIFTLNNLNDGSVYYFVATAYDTENNESGYSNEVFTQIEPDISDTIPPDATTNLSVVILSETSAEIFELDADTPATGGNLDIEPLVTPFGSITFVGEISSTYHDLDMDAVRSSGAVFDIVNGFAEMSFDFDVASVSFIYGGNGGSFNIEARDMDGAVLDSFFQASTHDGEPAGPITLAGPNIRSLYWEEPGGSFAPIDNLTIAVVSVREN